MTSVHELQHDEGEDWFTQGGCVENCVRVDQPRCPGKSNALTQIAIELTLTDNCYTDPRYVAGRHEVP